MANIIVAFAKLQDAKSIKNVLMRSGFSVLAVCTTGAQVLSRAEDWNDGIVVCGYRFPDMMHDELRELLSPNMAMVVISAPSHWVNPIPGGMVCLPLPLRVHDFIGTVEMIGRAGFRKHRKHKDLGQDVVRAKALLMEKKGMTEAQAHRYIQKCSMDSGCNLAETAGMIISLLRMGEAK